MAKMFRFQKVRTDDRKRPERNEGKDDGHFVIEPLDIALVVIILLIVVWLQWLMGTLAA